MWLMVMPCHYMLFLRGIHSSTNIVVSIMDKRTCTTDWKALRIRLPYLRLVDPVDCVLIQERHVSVCRR